MIQLYQSANIIIPADYESKLGAILIGDVNSSNQQKILKNSNIKTIISCGKQFQTLIRSFPLPEIKQILIPIMDRQKESLIQYFDLVYQQIQKNRLYGGILIQCFSGTSRSVIILISYLIRKYPSKKIEQLIQQIKKKRPCISPSQYFIKQLKQFKEIIKKRAQENENMKEIKNNGPSIKRHNLQAVRGAARSVSAKILSIQEWNKRYNSQQKLNNKKNMEGQIQKNKKKKKDLCLIYGKRNKQVK